MTSPGLSEMADVGHVGQIDDGLLGLSSKENPPTKAKSLLVCAAVAVATWPPWKVLSWASRWIFLPFTPPLELT